MFVQLRSPRFFFQIRSGLGRMSAGCLRWGSDCSWHGCAGKDCIECGSLWPWLYCHTHDMFIYFYWKALSKFSAHSPGDSQAIGSWDTEMQRRVASCQLPGARWCHPLGETPLPLDRAAAGDFAWHRLTASIWHGLLVGCLMFVWCLVCHRAPLSLTVTRMMPPTLQNSSMP